MTVLGSLGLAVLGVAPGEGCAPPPPEPTAQAPARGPLPGDSLYQLPIELTDATGATAPLALHRGHPTVVSMFYASCPAACPMLIHDIQALEARLSDEARAELRVLLVSFDPARDTPPALSALAAERHVDTTRWTLASVGEDDVRTLAATLGISYRKLDNGHFNHSAVLTLLDADGVPTARIEGLSQPPEPILSALGVP